MSWRSCAQRPFRVCLFTENINRAHLLHTYTGYGWGRNGGQRRLDPEWWRSHELARSVFSHGLVYDLEETHHENIF